MISPITPFMYAAIRTRQCQSARHGYWSRQDELAVWIVFASYAGLMCQPCFTGWLKDMEEYQVQWSAFLLDAIDPQ